MRRLTYLAAAVAATAALALIPLAASTPASAATKPPPQAGVAEVNWAGYEDDMIHPTEPSSNSGGMQFDEIYAQFKVPGINCGKSVIGPREYSAAFRKTHGNIWSAVSFWAGLDGEQGKKTIEQAGVDAICSGPKAYATYKPFYQDWTGTTNFVTLTGSKHNPGTVRVGDTIQMYVADAQPHTAKPSQTGYLYAMGITDVTRNVKWTATVKAGAGRAPDSSVEVVTEAASDGPYASAALDPSGTIGLADFTPVTYIGVEQSSFPIGYVYGISMAAAEHWTLTEKYVKGNGKILIGTSGIDNAGQVTSFTNTFG